MKKTKEEMKAYKAAHYENNKDKYKERSIERHFRTKDSDLKKIKLEFYTIYLLSDFDGNGNGYVGITTNIHRRLSKHRWLGKNISNMSILGFEDEECDARITERNYHLNGYKGKSGFAFGHKTNVK